MFCRSIIFYHLRRSLWSSSVLANRCFSCFWLSKLYEIEERVIFHSRNHWCSFPEKVCLMLFVTGFFYIWSICVYDKWKLKWFSYVRLIWSILLLNLMLPYANWFELANLVFKISGVNIWLVHMQIH